MKLSNEQIKKIAEHVRLFFSEDNRKLVTPLFKYVKYLQDELNKLDQRANEPLLPGFKNAPTQSTVRFPPYVFPEEVTETTTTRDYLISLIMDGKEEELERMAKVKKTTVEKLKESIK